MTVTVAFAATPRGARHEIDASVHTSHTATRRATVTVPRTVPKLPPWTVSVALDAGMGDR